MITIRITPSKTVRIERIKFYSFVIDVWDISDLSCYSCMYVEGKENSTNRGCESAKPPREYQTTECFGFGNIKAASNNDKSYNFHLF